ncbi:hypothetical protein [Amycolatopsis sp. VC5-11]|uniref:hypothetical protein n=1 Tax=Amycolatopsis sp. VC5-11 TaxID=3120156 RepID=UPI00300BCA84
MVGEHLAQHEVSAVVGDFREDVPVVEQDVRARGVQGGPQRQSGGDGGEGCQGGDSDAGSSGGGQHGGGGSERGQDLS